jgi:hypothetical protein
MRRRAGTTSPLLLCALLAACGGGDGSSSAANGSVTLHAVWQRPSAGGAAVFEGSDGVPAVVQTVEVRIVTPERTIRELVDPDETTRASISGVPAGHVTVFIFGYDVRLLGLPDLTQVDVAPSYASAGLDILVRAGRTTNAGEIQVSALPFVTEFDPLPDDVVETTRPVQFLLAIAVGDLDASSIDIDVGDSAAVVGGVAAAGVVFEPCRDGTASPCGGMDRGLGGFRFQSAPAELPELSTVTVSVRAAGGLDFQYSFDTESRAAAIAAASERRG